MPRKGQKPNRQKDLTARYLAGELDDEGIESQQRFSERSANAQQDKILRTALLRANEEQLTGDLESLPLGQVIQVYSLFCDVEHEGKIHQCVVRKTVNKIRASQLAVGDYVRFRDTGVADGAVVEQILPRKTVLTRADSFNSAEQQPIVANAEQMLIVVSLVNPIVKWGLVDRMIVAARSGGLAPIVCLNKIDLPGELPPAREILNYYESIGIPTLQSSAQTGAGLDALRGHLKDKVTVIAGHSGVGKSSLINTIQPLLHLRVGEVSRMNDKGRHTTTSARRYKLDFGGQIIDTPGVKLFGLWGVTEENLLDYFPDINNDTAPPWRIESAKRIAESL
jgi:ribosome biogenesis GTPase / thiamine phosphate phosphatase